VNSPGGLARVVTSAFAAAVVVLVVVDDDDDDDDGLPQHNSPVFLMFLNHHRIDLSETLKKSEGSSKLEHWSRDDHFSSCLKLGELLSLLLLSSHFLQPKRRKKLYVL